MEVRYVALNHCPEDREPNRHCLIFTTSGEKSYLNIYLELLNTQPSLQIRRPTAKEISYLPWYNLNPPEDWDPYSPFYDKKEHTHNLRRNCWGGWTLPFRTVNDMSIILKHLPSREYLQNPVQYIHQASYSSQALCNVNPALYDCIFRDLM